MTPGLLGDLGEKIAGRGVGAPITGDGDGAAVGEGKTGDVDGAAGGVFAGNLGVATDAAAGEAAEVGDGGDGTVKVSQSSGLDDGAGKLIQR